MRHMAATLGSAALAATLFAGSAHATIFAGQVSSVSANNGSGLLIETAASSSFIFSLNNIGDMATRDAFDIWTDETFVNSDDTNGRPIQVSLSFTAPPPAFGGTFDGKTIGGSILFVSGGAVTWDGPTQIAFGNTGILQVELSDEVFNLGLFGNLTPGRAHGATVEAKFTLVRADIPEPATFGVLGAGLIGLGFATRRRKVA